MCTYYLVPTRTYVRTFNDSAHDGLGHGAAVSPITACNFLKNNIKTQSIILMIR